VAISGRHCTRWSPGPGIVVAELCSQAIERRPQQTRDLRLGQAELLRDLCLGEVAEVAQLEESPLALGEASPSPREQEPRLAARLLAAARLDRVERRAGLRPAWRSCVRRWWRISPSIAGAAYAASAGPRSGS
jgi:hypothetical protein